VKRILVLITLLVSFLSTQIYAETMNIENDKKIGIYLGEGNILLPTSYDFQKIKNYTIIYYNIFENIAIVNTKDDICDKSLLLSTNYDYNKDEQRILRFTYHYGNISYNVNNNVFVEENWKEIGKPVFDTKGFIKGIVIYSDKDENKSFYKSILSIQSLLKKMDVSKRLLQNHFEL
jgi:hypothetical protein